MAHNFKLEDWQLLYGIKFRLEEEYDNGLRLGSKSYKFWQSVRDQYLRNGSLSQSQNDYLTKVFMEIHEDIEDLPAYIEEYLSCVPLNEI
jgi:transcription termination factor NusB